MHGLMLAELQRYIEDNVGPHSWQETCRQAGVGRTSYNRLDDYPETDLGELLVAGARVIGVPLDSMLEDFGTFMVPGLMHSCAPHIPGEWRVLDLLQDETRMRLLAERLTGRSVRPLPVNSLRLSEREVRISYGSERRLCGLTRGIIRGLLAHFREIGTVKETACMLKGADRCVIEVTRLGN